MRLHAFILILASVSISCVGIDMTEEDEAVMVDETVQALSASASSCDPPTYNGVHVRCAGTNCSSGPGWCQCDGNYKHCTPVPCSISTSCEGSGPVSCSGYYCSVLGAANNKVCGGVECSGVQQWCPPLPGDLECY